uniref:Protein V2 n=1 Tax=Tomato leaf curl Joydebpur virus TaxID=309390 RepID=A0A1Y0DIW9_9GEMI|nr:pre-coat protein [Tomato leaf curl Joydebpur virus]
MWDPLVNDFPETVHGFRCMLAVKYLQLVEKTYSPDTLGNDLIRDLISVSRARNYVEATSRYNHFHARLEGTPPSQFGRPNFQPGCCPHVPVPQTKSMGEQAPDQEAQDFQDVQKPRWS